MWKPLVHSLTNILVSFLLHLVHIWGFLHNFLFERDGEWSSLAVSVGVNSWMSRNYFQPRQSNQRAQLVKETFISEVLGSNPASRRKLCFYYFHSNWQLFVQNDAVFEQAAAQLSRSNDVLEKWRVWVKFHFGKQSCCNSAASLEVSYTFFLMTLQWITLLPSICFISSADYCKVWVQSQS